MTEPQVAGTLPIAADVEEGKSYFWCSCGRSATQPFCDGAHKGTGFTPVRYDAPRTARVYFCTCKQTAAGPLCDGAHKGL